MSASASQLRRAVQYLRVSTDMQRYSLANQAAAIAEYAALEGYDVIRSYEDAGRSGVTAKGRTGLANLMADVLGGDADFEAILVLDVSRWGRYQDPDEAAHYEFLCRSAGVEVRYCAEIFGVGPTSSVLKQIKRVMAGEYSRELSEKVRRGNRRHEALGHCPGSNCPYGIQRQEVLGDETPGRMLARSERKARPEYSVRYAPGVPEEQAVARSIFRMFVRQKLPNRAIADRLNAAGTFYHDGRPWSADMIHRLLECELLAGKQWANKVGWHNGWNTGERHKDQWRLVRTFTPVVPRRLFDEARARRVGMRGRANGKTRTEMLDDLRRILRQHGEISCRLISADDRSHSIHSYFAKFGSLAAAYAEIGYFGSRLSRGRNPDGSMLSRAQILDGLRHLAGQYGYVSASLIQDNRFMPSTNYIALMFGSLPAAYEAAGVPHSRGRRPDMLFKSALKGDVE